MRSVYNAPAFHDTAERRPSPVWRPGVYLDHCYRHGQYLVLDRTTETAGRRR